MLTDRRTWLRPAVLIVGAITLLRWVLLAFDRTDLYVDEAQYWLWGQEFAFGYYSKPPLIAWVIGAVTTLAGSDAPFWVRMPGAALHGATALILAALTARIYGARLAVWVAAAYATLPMVALGSLLISTDTVMAPCFAAALYFHRRLIETPLARFAALAGAAAGLGLMAKYAAVYFLIGVALAAVLRRDQRISWGHTGVMAAACLVVISPNIAWNLAHQFTTLSHTADNVGWVRSENPLSDLNPAGLVEFFVSQFAVMGPILFAATEDTNHALIRSPDAIAQVDAEIKRIVNDAHAEAKRILTTHRDQLETVALALIEYETLTGEEIKQLMAGEKIARPDPSADAPKPIRSKLPGGKKVDAEGDSGTIH